MNRVCTRYFAMLFLLAAATLSLTACGTTKDSAQKEQPVAPREPAAYVPAYPLGLSADSAVIPRDNPLTVEKIKLGKRLFFEKSLSIDGTISCATCHIPEKEFSEPEQFSAGIGGKLGNRHSPTIINRIFSAAQFWDGRAASLEEQALGPVQNPVEMGMPNMAVVIEKLKNNSAYVGGFKAAFPPDGAITPENVGRAIASFERTILCGNSAYDRFVAGDKTAMSESAQRGWNLFRDENKGNCETCHAGANFTDENYNNLGVGMTARKPDMGRFLVTKLEGHQGAFKTPTLRNVARRSRYLHDGSLTSLEEVVALYAKGGQKNKWLSPKMKKLNLSAQEQQDLVEFLKALTGEVTWYEKGSMQ